LQWAKEPLDLTGEVKMLVEECLESPAGWEKEVVKVRELADSPNPKYERPVIDHWPSGK
jgi:hypothetical protein